MARYNVKIIDAETKEELVNSIFRHRSVVYSMARRIISSNALATKGVYVKIYSAKTGKLAQIMFLGEKIAYEIATNSSRHNQAALRGIFQFSLKGKFVVAA